MPPPTNISALTATDLGTLPADVTQAVDDAGTTYTVWYKFTAPANTVVIGAWGFGDLSVYIPTTRPYSGPAAAPVQILSIAGVNVPIQFPVTTLTEYFLEFTTNGGNPTPANLRVRVEAATNEAIDGGDILIANADIGFPATIYDPSGNFDIRKFAVGFPVSNAGSQACILSNGAILINQDSDMTVRFLNASFSELANTGYGASGTDSSIAIRAQRTLNRIYFTKDVNPVDVMYYDSTGVISVATETLTAINNCRALCMNNDGTILYNAATSFNAAIRRWDMVGHVAMADFATGIASHFTGDILILPNDEIVVLFADLIANTCIVRRYSTLAVVEATYNFDDIAQDAIPRLAYPVETELSTHFWVWGHTISGGGLITNLVKVKIDDGTRVASLTQAEFAVGAYDYTATATPIARFGNHNCCPYVILQGPVTPGLFKFVPDKRTDHNGTIEVKIPDPTFKTGLMP